VHQAALVQTRPQTPVSLAGQTCACPFPANYDIAVQEFSLNLLRQLQEAARCFLNGVRLSFTRGMSYHFQFNTYTAGVFCLPLIHSPGQRCRNKTVQTQL
jgi:hypothetical protein